MLSNNKYFLCGVASYIIWGFLPLLLKQLNGSDHFEIIFYRVLIAAILMSSLFMFQFPYNRDIVAKAFEKSKKDFCISLFLSGLGGLFLVINWMSYVYTVNNISIHAAAFGYMILPITTALFAIIFLKEKLSLTRWIAVGLSALSCYIIGNVSTKEILFILEIALSYSFYLISQRKNILLPRPINLSLQMIVGTLALLFVHPLSHNITELNGHFWFYIFIISAFFTVTPLLLNLFALSGMKASQLSFLVYINPIISFIIGITLYNEKLNSLTLFAYGILGVSIFIFNWDLIGNLSYKNRKNLFNLSQASVNSLSDTESTKRQ